VYSQTWKTWQYAPKNLTMCTWKLGNVHVPIRNLESWTMCTCKVGKFGNVHLKTWQCVNNWGSRSIWDKKWSTIGNVLGNTLGLLGTVLRTCWEHIENRKKEEKKSPLFPPLKPKRKKTNHPWTFSLALWNFYFQNCSSPFSTWTNTLSINWGF
jgi:hypothetical protein